MGPTRQWWVLISINLYFGRGRMGVFCSHFPVTLKRRCLCGRSWWESSRLKLIFYFLTVPLLLNIEPDEVGILVDLVLSNAHSYQFVYW